MKTEVFEFSDPRRDRKLWNPFITSAEYSSSFSMVRAVCLKPWLVMKPVPEGSPVLGFIIRLMALVVALSPMCLFFPMPMVETNTYSRLPMCWCASFRIARARYDSATLSSLPIVMASLGRVIKAASKLIYATSSSGFFRSQKA